MKSPNIGLMLSGIVLNIAFTLLYFGTSEYFFIKIIFIVAIIFNILGLLLTLVLDSKIGPIFVIIGGVIYVPLGLVSIIGARKILDQKKQDDFHQSHQTLDATADS